MRQSEEDVRVLRKWPAETISPLGFYRATPSRSGYLAWMNLAASRSFLAAHSRAIPFQLFAGAKRDNAGEDNFGELSAKFQNWSKERRHADRASIHSCMCPFTRGKVRGMLWVA